MCLVLRIFLPLFLLAWLVNPVQASRPAEVPWSLVCYKQENLQRVLNKVVNPMQVLKNSIEQTVPRGEYNELGCSYVQIPEGSTARLLGFHQNSHGLIFPVFVVHYATTGQRMYTLDGVFQSEHWEVGRRYLTPKSCEVLDRGVGPKPDYVRVPRHCRRYIITYPR